MKKKLLAALIAATMVVPTIAAPVFAEETEPENTVTGDASAEGSFVVWGWNDDIKKILDGPFKDAYPEDYERIVFVNTGGSDYYQNKLDPMLDDTSNELYPDLMGLEVDYVQKYVNSDWVVTADSLGITADDYKNMYPVSYTHLNMRILLSEPSTVWWACLFPCCLFPFLLEFPFLPSRPCPM